MSIYTMGIQDGEERKKMEKAFKKVTAVNFPQLLKIIAYISRKLSTLQVGKIRKPIHRTSLKEMLVLQ